MKWFRYRWEGRWLALFAMALQLAVTLGHIHGFSHITLQIERAVEGGLETASGSQPRHDNRHEESSCQLCGTLKLAGSLVLPDALALACNDDKTVSYRVLDKTAFVLTRLERSCQVRAPPPAILI